MIVKIDHLALAAGSGPGQGLLRDLGYSLQTEQNDLATERIKDGMLAGTYGKHGLALYASPGGLGIELISHVSGVESPSYMLPICENPPQGLFEFAAPGVSIGGNRMRLGKSLAGKTAILGCETDSGKTGIRDVWLDVPHRDGTDAFWECLGFKKPDAEEVVPTLEFRSPLSPHACRLYFGGGRFAAAGRERPMLDDPGFNCMALLSSSPARERLALEEKGFEPTASARLAVGGKPLEVFFARGPSGELVEVVGLAR